MDETLNQPAVAVAGVVPTAQIHGRNQDKMIPRFKENVSESDVHRDLDGEDALQDVFHSMPEPG